MLTHPTLGQMVALGLTSMLEAWKALGEQSPDQTLDRNEWLGLMLDREAVACADKRFANRLRNARMRFPNACIEDIDFAAAVAWTGARSCRWPKATGSGRASRSFSRARPAPARPGWPAPLPIRPPVSIIPSPIFACPASSRIWPGPVSGWHDMIGEPPSPTPSLTGSSTTHAASNSRETACAERTENRT